MESARQAFSEYSNHPSECNLPKELIDDIMESVFDDDLCPSYFHETPLRNVIQDFDLTTSSGHDGSKWGPGKTAIWYNGAPGPKYDEYVEEVGAKIDEILACTEEELRQRKGPEMIFEGALKQELVANKYGPDGEVTRFKTKESRYLSASAVVDTGIGGVAFDGLKKGILANHDNNEFTMGINASGDDWHILYRKHTNFFKHFAGDFKKFDKSHIARLMWAICDAMLEWIDSERHRKLILWFFAHIINSLHCFLGEFHMWLKSMPSGNVLTTIINMIMLAFLYRYSFYRCGYDFRSFKKHVILSLYGDDSLVSVAPWVDFGPKDVADAMAEFKLDYTDHNGKEIVSNDYFELEELTFLKRGFNEVRGFIMGNLAMQTIRSLYEWTRTDDVKIIQDNYRLGHVELARHGKEIYERSQEWTASVSQSAGVYVPSFNQAYKLARGGEISAKAERFTLLLAPTQFIPTPQSRVWGVSGPVWDQE